MTRSLLAALLLLLAAAAPAPDRPALLATRDAVVGYHLQPASGEAIDVLVGYRAGGKALRLDLPDRTFMIVDPAERTLVMVVPLERTTVDLPWSDGPQTLFLLDDRARFVRKAELTIAGQRCTTWEATLQQGRQTVCVTADGLVLRNQTQDALGRRNLIEAFAIRYAAMADADFVVPPGFDRLMPSLGVPTR